MVSPGTGYHAEVTPWLMPLVLAAPAPEHPVVHRRTTVLPPSPLGLSRVEVRTSVGGVPVLVPDHRGLAIAKPPLRPVPPAVTPFRANLDGGAARERVRAETGWVPVEATLVAVPHARETRLMWKVDVGLDWETLTSPIYLVDARTGVVRKWLESVVDADVRVFPQNPVATPDSVVATLGDLDPTQGHLASSRVEVLNCVDPTDSAVACDPAPVAMADSNGDFLYPAPDLNTRADHVQRTDSFAEVAAYYHADRYFAALDDWGFPGLPCDAAGGTSRLVVNYRFFGENGWIPLDNAAYVPSCDLTIAVGQGRRADWAYDGDVIYHELTHGVIDQRNGPDVRLISRRLRSDAVVSDAGAMGEGMSDFIASVLTDDPVHADYVNAMLDQDPRTGENDYACPRDIVGEVHGDGEIFGAALWDLYRELGPAVAPVALEAVGSLTGDATFEEGAEAIVTAVRAVLGNQAGDVAAQVMAARGLDDCIRVASLLDYRRRIFLAAKGYDDRGYEPMRPPPLQFVLNVPEDAETLELTFDMVVVPPPGWSPLPQVEVLVKHDEPIVFTYEHDPDGTNLVDADSEQHISDLNDGTASIPVEPGRNVYLALFNRGLHPAVLSNFAPRWESSSDPGGSSSGAGTTGEFQPALAGTGCGCRARLGGRESWLWLPLVVAAGQRRRRA